MLKFLPSFTKDIGPRSRNRISQAIINQTPADFMPNCDDAESVTWLPSPNGIY